jgi:hypothetical protein
MVFSRKRKEVRIAQTLKVAKSKKVKEVTWCYFSPFQVVAGLGTRRRDQSQVEEAKSLKSQEIRDQKQER